MRKEQVALLTILILGTVVGMFFYSERGVAAASAAPGQTIYQFRPFKDVELNPTDPLVEGVELFYSALGNSNNNPQESPYSIFYVVSLYDKSGHRIDEYSQYIEVLTPYDSEWQTMDSSNGVMLLEEGQRSAELAFRLAPGVDGLPPNVFRGLVEPIGQQSYAIPGNAQGQPFRFEFLATFTEPRVDIYPEDIRLDIANPTQINETDPSTDGGQWRIESNVPVTYTFGSRGFDLKNDALNERNIDEFFRYRVWNGGTVEDIFSPGEAGSTAFSLNVPSNGTLGVAEGAVILEYNPQGWSQTPWGQWENGTRTWRELPANDFGRVDVITITVKAE